MRWAAQQRQEYITKRLAEAGELQRADLIQAFGISTSQATADIAAYQRANPGALAYDGTGKRYVRANGTPKTAPAHTASSDDADELRKRLVAARTKLELTAKQMAERLQTPRVTYQQWESASRRTPGIAVLAAELLVGCAVASAPDDPRRDEVMRVLRSALSDMDWEIVQLCAQGRSVPEIAEVIGVPAGVIYGRVKGLRRRGYDVVAAQGKRVRPTASAALAGQVLLLADGSRTAAEIAAELGCSTPSVYNALARLRAQGSAVKLRRGPTSAAARERDDIVRRRIDEASAAARERDDIVRRRIDEGASYALIGAELGVTRSRAQQIASRLGIEAISSRAHARERKQQKLARRAARKEARQALAEKIRGLVEAGASVNSAAQELGISPQTARRVCHSCGIDIGSLSRHPTRWHPHHD